MAPARVVAVVFAVLPLIALVACGRETRTNEPAGDRGDPIDGVVRLRMWPVHLHRHDMPPGSGPLRPHDSLLAIRYQLRNTSAEIVRVGNCSVAAIDNQGNLLYRTQPKFIGDVWLRPGESAGWKRNQGGWAGWHAPARFNVRQLRSVRRYDASCRAFRWIGPIPEYS